MPHAIAGRLRGVEHHAAAVLMKTHSLCTSESDITFFDAAAYVFSSQSHILLPIGVRIPFQQKPFRPNNACTCR